MIWIPPGTLIAGTLKDRTPRIADEELPGEPIELGGFYIDEFAYPNEGGAIPKTGMNRDEAVGLCARRTSGSAPSSNGSAPARDRATRPTNTARRTGPSECLMGQSGRLAPSGLRVVVPQRIRRSRHARRPLGMDGQHLAARPRARTRRRARRQLRRRRARGAMRQCDACSRRRARRPDLGVRCCAGDAEPRRDQAHRRARKAARVAALRRRFRREDRAEPSRRIPRPSLPEISRFASTASGIGTPSATKSSWWRRAA